MFALKVVFALFTSQFKENELHFLLYSDFWFLPCSNPYPSYARDYQIAALRNDECSSIDGVRSPAKEALSKRRVLRSEMVDKSTSHLQTSFGPVFYPEAVQTGLLLPE